MNKLANILREVGQRNSLGGQDTILAHINPHEATLLQLLGGSGRYDAETGLPHFDTASWGDPDLAALYLTHKSGDIASPYLNPRADAVASAYLTAKAGLDLDKYLSAKF